MLNFLSWFGILTSLGYCTFTTVIKVKKSLKHSKTYPLKNYQEVVELNHKLAKNLQRNTKNITLNGKEDKIAT